MHLVLYIDSPETNEPAEVAAMHTPAVECLSSGRFLAEIPPDRLPAFVRGLSEVKEPFIIGVGANPLIAGAAALAGKHGLLQGIHRHRCGKGMLFKVPPGAERDFMARLPVALFWPLPENIRRDLKELGFLSGEDLRRAGEQGLRAHFGTLGYLIADFSRGIDRRQVQSNYPVPEIKWERAIEETADITVLDAFLSLGAAALARELRERQTGLRRLNLKIETASGVLNMERDFRGVAPEEPRIRLLLNLLLRGAAIEAPVTALSVTAEPYPLTARQVDLTAFREARRKERLIRAMDFVNRKYPGCLATAGTLALANRRERVLQLWM